MAREEEEEISTSPGVSEFVSDAFDGAAIDQEDLRKEMEQLVLDKGKTPLPDGLLAQSLCFCLVVVFLLHWWPCCTSGNARYCFCFLPIHP